MSTARLEELDLAGDASERNAACRAAIGEPDAQARRRAAAGRDDGTGTTRAGEPLDRRRSGRTVLECANGVGFGFRECGGVGGGNERDNAEEGLELHLG